MSNNFEILQKIAELTCSKLKILKNGTIDLEAAQKYFNETIVDDTWKQIIKNSVDFCQPEILQNAEKLQAGSLIPKERCDISFEDFLNCVYIHSFAVRSDK